MAEGELSEGEPSGGVPEWHPRCGGAVVSLCKATAAAPASRPAGSERHRGTAAARDKTLLFMNYCTGFFFPAWRRLRGDFREALNQFGKDL